MNELERELSSRFGFKQFRPGQQAVIERFIEGRDVLAVLPTGTGKSLLFQFPSSYVSGTVVILSPLLSLMMDQIEQMKSRGLKKVVALNSFQSSKERHYALQHIHSYDYIFLSPEILQNDKVKNSIASLHIAYFVLDEAHCLVQWGLDFRPDYLRAIEWINQAFSKQLLALTATANEQSRKDIKRLLMRPEMQEVVETVDRPSIALESIKMDTDSLKMERIENQVLTYEGPGILYVQSRKKAVSLASRLQQLGIQSAAYHGGMNPEDRSLIQHQFMLGEVEWICATYAFGMGIHKSNIRQVIHDHIPTSLSNYMQEIGRASRDGKPSLATLYYTQQDIQKSQFIATQDLPDEHEISQFFNNPSIQLNEQQSRILTYWKDQLSEDELLTLFTTLRKNKITEITRLYDVLSTDQCLRQALLASFDDHLQVKPVPCCDRCGETRMLLEKRTNLLENTAEINWQKRLNQIFP